MGIDDFLQHKTSGGRGAYLTGWKKEGKVNTWLHTQRLPMAVWRHAHIPKVVVLEDRQTNESVRHIWSGEWVCPEDESVLLSQYAVDPKGARENPPEYCPICRLNDYIRRAVQAGRIPWTKEVFRFEGDVEKERLILHAGGMFMTRKQYDALDAEEIKEARKLGVNVKEMWKENCYAKAEYLFCVVDDAHPESGIQKAFNPSSLGDKVKDVIADMRESKGVEEGDPTINPYCIQWQYREGEPDPKKMYHALAIQKQRLTPAIEKLIYGPPPDISKDIRPFNLVEMRAYLEEHALIKLPWDQIFDVKVREEREEPAPEPTRQRRAAAPTDDEPEPTPAKGAKRRGAAPARAKFPDDDDEHAVACENPDCEKAMWDDEHECPHCGSKYDDDFKLVVAEPEPPKKAAGPKKRGVVPPPAESTPAPAKAKAPEPAPSEPAGRQPGDDEEEDNEDPLPF